MQDLFDEVVDASLLQKSGFARQESSGSTQSMDVGSVWSRQVSVEAPQDMALEDGWSCQVSVSSEPVESDTLQDDVDANKTWWERACMMSAHGSEPAASFDRLSISSADDALLSAWESEQKAVKPMHDDVVDTMLPKECTSLISLQHAVLQSRCRQVVPSVGSGGVSLASANRDVNVADDASNEEHPRSKCCAWPDRTIVMSKTECGGARTRASVVEAIRSRRRSRSAPCVSAVLVQAWRNVILDPFFCGTGPYQLLFGPTPGVSVNWRARMRLGQLCARIPKGETVPDTCEPAAASQEEAPEGRQQFCFNSVSATERVEEGYVTEQAILESDPVLRTSPVLLLPARMFVRRLLASRRRGEA
jgi:hypothetical protein